jgi:hypothetical protein
MKRFLVLLAATAASCSTPSISVIPYAAMNSLEGSVASSGGGLAAGTDLADIGLDESESVFGGRIDFAGSSSHWSIASSSSSFAGSGPLDSSLDIGGFEFDVSVDIDTEMEVGTTSVMWTYDWGLGDTAHFGLGLGITSLDLAMVVTGSVETFPGSGVFTTETGSMDETLPIPMIGVRLGGDIGPVRLEASYGFLDVSADDAEVSVTDFDVYVGLDILGDFGSLIIGYREFAFDAEFEDSSDSPDLDLTLGGPYAGIRIGF